MDDVSMRYIQKVKDFCDGFDPFVLKSEKASLPRNVGYYDIYNYCVFKDSYFTHEEFKAYKTLEAYKLFENGWVQSIECKHISNGFIVVAKVKHSYRVSLTPLRCWVSVDNSGIILTAHCNCMAGLGEVCTHIGAVLFMLEAWNRKSDEIDQATSLTESRPPIELHLITTQLLGILCPFYLLIFLSSGFWYYSNEARMYSSRPE